MKRQTKKKSFKSAISFMLTLLMLFSVISPITSLAITIDNSKLGTDTYLTSKTDYTVAPGITETHITTNNSTGSFQIKGYALNVDLSNPTTSVIASYKDYDGTKWGMQRVRDQAYAAESKRGVNVVAGVNADFFNMQTGAPLGMLVMNSIVYNNVSNRPYFGITKDGKAVIGAKNPDVANLAECIGGSLLLVKDGKVAVTNDDPALAPRTAVGIKADGTVVIYVADGRQAPTSCGNDYYQLADTMLALGCVDALNLDGGGSTTFISQHEGSDELICRNSPSDGLERTVSSALLVCSSAKPTGIFDHASLSPNNEVYTPGSEVQFSATGVDSAGAAVALPADGTFALADSSYGTISADGLFVSNGKEGTVTVNYISGKKVCGDISIEIHNPDTLYVPSAEVSLGFEETTDFGIVAKYQERTVNMKAGDIIWSATDDDGKPLSDIPGIFDGLTFTTLENGSINIRVKAVYAGNESLYAEIRAIIGAAPVILYDFENYTTDQAAAEADPDLKYVPSFDMPVYDPNHPEGLSSAQQADVFYNEGYPLYLWANGAFNDPLNSASSSIVSKEDGHPVRFGDHSYRIDFDFSSYNNSMNGNFYIRVTDPSHSFEGSPTALGCWVYAPEGMANTSMYLNCSNNTNGLVYAKIAGPKIDWVGWKYVEMDLTNPSVTGAGPSKYPFGFYQGCGVFWLSYQPGSAFGETANYIYLDNIQLIYGANVDDVNNPEISSIRAETETGIEEIVDGETTFNTNTFTLKASYNDFDGKYKTGIDPESVKMIVDGVDVSDNANCYHNDADEEIYLYDAVFADGIHNIKISVADLFGNVTTETRFFTVSGGKNTTEVSFVSVDEAPVLGSAYKMAVTSNNAADVLTADINVKVSSYFIQYWEDISVEPGADYELTSDVVYNALTSTASFSVERKADSSSGSDTLATIIVNIPTDVPDGLEVTYRIDKGELTYASEKDETFVSSFSGKITTSCIAPLVIVADTMLVGTDGGYIHVYDNNGQPVGGVDIYYAKNDSLIGTTDDDGKIFVTDFVSSVMSYSIYAKKGDIRSFIYTSQSFSSGGETDGSPSYIKLNASADPATTQSVSWMSSPIASKGAAVVLYAEKSAYDENGEAALTAFNGTSQIVEMASSGGIKTNYAVRINSALITGLKPNTEYVYKAGDGESMSDLKTFSTTKAAEQTNFFIIGDTQATDTTNTDKITQILSSSGTDYAFGIQTGDAADNGGNYTMWSNIAKVFSGNFLGSQDMIHVLGNHEYYGDDDGSNASAYFNLPGSEIGGEAPLCYSVQYGNVYVAVINYSNLAGYREAAEWLVKDAAASGAAWKVLTMHQPAYYTNPSGNNTSMQEIIANAVDEAGIDFVFSGHDHSYARTEPLTDGEIDTANGAVYYICGSTGEKSYEIVDNPLHHFATLVSDYNATYLTASVTDTEFTVVSYDYNSNGSYEIIDSYTMRKEVSCTDDGHDYILDDGIISCSVCGYTISSEGYTGLVTNAQTGAKQYLIGGNIITGWVSVGNDHYYFDKNGNAVTGTLTLDGHTYIFGEDGKMIKGSLEKNSDGSYSYYINGEKQRGWFEIDGYWYYFSRTKGFKSLSGEAKVEGMTYTFSSNGRLIKGAWYTTSQGTSYFWGPNPVTGLHEIDGYTYYFYSNTYMCVNDSVEIDGEIYSFDSEGKFSHYGEHVDANNDGRCDECSSIGSFFRRFLMRIRDFFLRIRDFFFGIFG